MRGEIDWQQEVFFSLNIEDRIPADHPLRAVKTLVDPILRAMDKDFAAAYRAGGRPSVPPEQLLKALLLQSLYSIRSEIKLAEAIEFNFLYRWFLDMSLAAPMWTPEVFSMNRKRFDDHQLVRKFFDRIVDLALTEKFASQDHFTIDGTLIRSLASHKSLVPREGAAEAATGGDDNKPEPPAGPPSPADRDPGNPTVIYRGQKRTNKTHVSKTDPEARLYRKACGKEAHPSHSGHAFMENRNGLVMDIEVEAADGHAERRAAHSMLDRTRRRHNIAGENATVGVDAGYDATEFLEELEKKKIVAHVAIKNSRKGANPVRQRAIDRETTEGYMKSQRIRKRVEEVFGWAKTNATLARTRFVGRWKIAQEMTMIASAYNLVRLVSLKKPKKAVAAA